MDYLIQVITLAGNESGNVRNGSRPKTVLTDSTGQVQVEVPRDRAGTFEPQIVSGMRSRRASRSRTWTPSCSAGSSPPRRSRATTP
jgi:transposase-like protein